MNSGSDDFWGGQADWSDRAWSQPTTRVPRIDAKPGDPDALDSTASDGAAPAHDVPLNAIPEAPIQRLKNGWASLLGSGANPTREHGIVRPDLAQADTPTQPGGISADMFDDLDDFDFTYGEPLTVSAATPAVASSAATQANVISDTDTDSVADGAIAGWDAEFAPARIDVDRQRVGASAGPGVDPLLVRLGAVALIAALLVPALLSLRGGDDASLIESSTTASTIDLLPEETTPLAEVAPTSPPTGQLDPNDLPPAVPVNVAPTTTVPVTSVAADEADRSTATNEPERDGSATLAATEATTAAVVDTPPATEAAATTQPAANVPATVDAPAERVERNCAIDYDVVAGDYWIRIADAAGVPLTELLEANGATVSTPLYPGRSICLPAGSTTPSPPTTVTPATTTPATTNPTTTAPTTTAPTTTPSNSNATPEEVQQIIRDVWPDELEERALEIAFRESRYVPTAKNFCCYGIFQIYWTVHRSWLADLGITNDQQLYDPAINARAAYALYERAGGWGPWGF